MRRSRRSKAEYGIDAPRMGMIILLAVIAALVIAVLLHSSTNTTAKAAGNIIFSLSPTGIIILFLALLYVKVEKFRHRDRMLNMLTWKGNETVLDVGTGRGLLMIGAAKRLITGKSFGIDIWNTKDLSNNSYRAVMANAILEDVKEKVTVLNADAQNIPIEDNYFDYVVSNLCIHNISDREGRAKACSEIMRVLKPGGVALISDFTHTREYAEEFKKMGYETTRTFSFLIAPVLLHIVKVVKR